jgi:hypothetical protein
MIDLALDTDTSITKEPSNYSNSNSLDDKELYKVERIVGYKVSYGAGVEEHLYKVR